MKRTWTATTATDTHQQQREFLVLSLDPADTSAGATLSVGFGDCEARFEECFYEHFPCKVAPAGDDGFELGLSKPLSCHSFTATIFRATLSEECLVLAPLASPGSPLRLHPLSPLLGPVRGHGPSGRS